ncbi:hypothetical protein ACULLL_14515 [Lysinibacillus irui]|uniref:hypothetical protein n=1 Tax=Lysinibacillus irui TaxID=2998077 RepID=UPI00404473BA
MKLFLYVITYLVTAIATLLASFPLAVIYQNVSGNDDAYFGLYILYLSPITVISSFIICYFLIKKITIKPILFGTIIGFWLIKVIQVINSLYISYLYKSNKDYIQNIFIRDTIDLYILLLPIVLVFLSHFLFKKYNNWLHISGFTYGATIGFVTSYVMVLFIRFLTNSLTSYFHFDTNELMVVIVGTAIFSILGSIIGFKKSKQIQKK